jgi:type IV pilus assembly protein PilM
MARAKSVWGVDIGQCALKALKLSNDDGQFQVEAFEVIEHPENLRGPDVDRADVFINSLGQFLAQNDVSDSDVAVSVPGQSSFMRFVKLPPVEPKRIPSIVRFEAEQQIPFPIDEVVWRWQTFIDPESPDVEVGIFAMKRMEIAEMLATMAFADLKVDLVQMAPLALYNFMCTDGQLATDGATLLADVGTDKTDLVVADGPRIWTRTIQIGGNNFTEALVRAFKLSFGEA